jgi:carboxymethylenebutenolidase
VKGFRFRDRSLRATFSFSHAEENVIVRETLLEISTPTGPMRTAVFTPIAPNQTARRTGGLVLYSEIFQLTAPVRRLACQVAGLGYLVMAPEVYHAHVPAGTVLSYDEPGKNRGNALKQSMTLSAFDADAQAVFGELRKHPACNGRVGAFGICLGGHLAFRAGLQKDVAAVGCFYPTDLHTGAIGPEGRADTLDRAADLKGELLLVFGRQDPHVPLEGRRRIYEAMHQADVCFTWHEFNAAHAFMRDEGERYDPAAARLGLSLAADLFSRCL